MNTNIKTSKHKHKNKNKTNKRKFKTNKRKLKTNKRKLKIGGFGFFGNNNSENNTSCVSSNVPTPTTPPTAAEAKKAVEETKKAEEAAEAKKAAEAAKEAAKKAAEAKKADEAAKADEAKKAKEAKEAAKKAAANSADKIKVISYNISWGSMSGNINDVTASKLAKICGERTKPHKIPEPTICLINVREFLDTEYTKGSLDFIALQEALNWETIINESTNLKQMGYVHHKVQINHPIYAELCTLYNHTKFKLLGVFYGDIIQDTLGIQKRDARPYHMLFLQKKSNTKNYIFINFHNGHNIDKDTLEKRFEFNEGIIGNFKDFSNHSDTEFKDIENDKIYKQGYIDPIIKKYNFNNDTNIIMAGDTNDQGTKIFWKGIKPFSNSNIPNLENIVVNTKNIQPPQTCCIDGIRKKNNKGPYYGDYIMISDGLDYIESNYVPDDDAFYNDKPASDHLPVMATIKETT